MAEQVMKSPLDFAEDHLFDLDFHSLKTCLQKCSLTEGLLWEEYESGEEIVATKVMGRNLKKMMK